MILLVLRYPEFNLTHIDLEGSSWAKSLFKRMGFVRRMATTGKVEVSEEVRKELETTYLRSIISIMENNKIPKPMVINLDQTPSKYVPCCNKTLATKGIKSVSVAGSTNKRTITATFSITMDGTFLPMQIIYSEKTYHLSPFLIIFW